MDSAYAEAPDALIHGCGPEHKPGMTILDFRYLKHLDKTYVLATNSGRLYVAMMNAEICVSSIPHIDPSSWTHLNGCAPPVLIQPADFYPTAKGCTRFEPRPEENDAAVFSKRQEPLQIACSNGMKRLHSNLTARLTERELFMCEFLRLNPHPNIAEYRGVVGQERLKFDHNDLQTTIMLDTERVIEIKFKRYDCTLRELLASRTHINAKYCLKSIAAGIKHIHDLGYVHGDIKPDNIFVEIKDPKTSRHRHEYVVGDFDSAAPVGSVCELKTGTRRWAPYKRRGQDVVEEDDDWYAFRNLKIAMAKKTKGRVEDFDGIGIESTRPFDSAPWPDK